MSQLIAQEAVRPENYNDEGNYVGNSDSNQKAIIERLRELAVIPRDCSCKNSK